MVIVDVLVDRRRDWLGDVPVLALEDYARGPATSGRAASYRRDTRWVGQRLFAVFGFRHFRGHEQEQLAIFFLHARQEAY